jgi:hypothetical protein
MLAYLDTNLLERFEAALRATGAAIVSVWEPGLSDDEIGAIMSSVGIDLPDEARLWWRWHNGVAANSKPSAQELVPGRPLLDLGIVAEEFSASRAITRDVHGLDYLLQPVSDQPWLFFDCSGDRDAPVPILVGGHGQDVKHALASIGELVKAWTELIEAGIFTTDAEGHWEWDFERVPENIRQLGIY